MLDFLRKIMPQWAFKIYHFSWALLGNLIYGFPGRKIKCIGITGTNGKSTTTRMVTEVLKSAGYKVGMTSTIDFEIAGRAWDNDTNRTNLGRLQFWRLLSRMVKEKCDYAVIEVSSEGLAWYRLWGVPFDVAVFTNLAPEHLNFHKTMENYRNAKGMLFASLAKSRRYKPDVPKVAIVNAEDKEKDYFLSFDTDRKITFGIKAGDIRASEIELNPASSCSDFSFGRDREKTCINVAGRFNVYNGLAAAAVGLSQGVKLSQITKALAGIKGVAGRMENVNQNGEYAVILDYAVTPDAFERLFKALRTGTKGKIISVFGATGERDTQKRPRLGEIAARLTDIVVVTDEEPYREDPEKIINEVYRGVLCVRKKDIFRIPNRLEAIKLAISMATKDDCVIITGIGHQKYRNVGGKKIKWDEKEIVKNILSVQNESVLVRKQK